MSDDDDLEDEDEEDDTEDDEDEDGRPASTDFDDDTEGRLVAGRSFELSGMTAGAVATLKKAVEAIGERTKLPLDVVPGGDFTDTGPGPNDEAYGSCIIGLPSGRGGTDMPDSIDRQTALDRLAAAKEIKAAVWDEIAALLPEKSREGFGENEVELWLVCVGPLAAAKLVFGIEGEEDAEGLPGTYHGGQNMEQEAFDTGVWGLRVGYVQYESPETEVVDLSDEAHARRVAELGREGGEYFMLARYD